MAEKHLPAGSVFKRPLSGVANHITRNHNAESIARYMKLDFGKRDKLGRVDRLDPFKPSKTIIAGGTGGGGRSHLHPFIPRTMSVRECARLQTFPDTYRFTGPVARQFTQVGNAVPPVLAYEMACAIYSSIYAKHRKNIVQIQVDMRRLKGNVTNVCYPVCNNRPQQLRLAIENKKGYKSVVNKGVAKPKRPKSLKARYARKAGDGKVK